MGRRLHPTKTIFRIKLLAECQQKSTANFGRFVSLQSLGLASTGRSLLCRCVALDYLFFPPLFFRTQPQPPIPKHKLITSTIL